MYGKKFAKRSPRKYGRKSAAKPRRSNGLKVKKTVLNPALRTYVKREIARHEETKFMSNTIAYKAGVAGTGFDTATGMGYNTSSNIIPVIQMGLGDQQRIANKISPVYCQVKGHILALPTSTTTNNFPNTPFYVRIVIWRQRQSMTTAVNDLILRDNVSSGGIPFNGTLDDLMYPYNKERYVIAASRQFMLQPNANGGTLPAENLSRYPVSKFFKIRVPVPKTFVYNDTAQDPSNCRWYFSVGIVNIDGTLSVNTNFRAQVTAECLLKYKDA